MWLSWSLVFPVISVVASVKGVVAASTSLGLFFFFQVHGLIEKTRSSVSEDKVGAPVRSVGLC